jgi:hypothetical protein
VLHADPGEVTEMRPVICIVGVQGESELNNTAYDASLEELLKQLQTDLACKEINLVSDCGLDVKKQLEGKKFIRKTQVEFAESHPCRAWVDTDDLNDRKEGIR